MIGASEQLDAIGARYPELLRAFLTTDQEEALYRASLLSQACIEAGLGPEDIVALHLEKLREVLVEMPFRAQAHAHLDAHQFLLEVMIAYGIKYREYLDLRLEATVRDLEIRAEGDRRRALEAERLDRGKSDLLATIAHELRTPITAALGNLDLARRTLARNDVDRLPARLDAAAEALQRLSRLTDELAAASRDDAPTLEMSDQPLAPLVIRAIQWAQPAASAKGVSLLAGALAPEAHALCAADALLSVLGNLLANAVRYTPAGGQVSVMLGAAAPPPAGGAWFEVSDTGMGIEPAALDRIWERYYRAPEARARESTGLGLGLALVRQIVDAHGGQIAVQSVPGVGTTFRVTLGGQGRLAAAAGDQAQEQEQDREQEQENEEEVTDR